MPRKGRGGARQGTPGKTYGNRSDLNAPKAIPIGLYRGQPYGARKSQEDAQRAVPVQAPTAVPGAVSPAPSGPAPGTLGGLTDPTARPNEPITHGLASGPGAGPEVLSRSADPDLDNLRAIYRMHPTNALLSLIESMQGG